MLGLQRIEPTQLFSILTTKGLGVILRWKGEGVEIQGGVYFFADSDNNRIVRYVVAVN